MPDVLIALLILVAALATGAYLAHQIPHGCRYRRTLQRVVTASNDPTNRRLGRELDDADDLLHGPR